MFVPLAAMKSSKAKKNRFPQVKSNQVIISCYQEKHKGLKCKIITSVLLNMNQSLKKENNELFCERRDVYSNLIA